MDIYGLMFTIAGGDVVNFWSNGNSGAGVNYGIAIATASTALDDLGGVTVPEPGSLLLLGAGVLGILARRRNGAAA